MLSRREARTTKPAWGAPRGVVGRWPLAGPTWRASKTKEDKNKEEAPHLPAYQKWPRAAGRPQQTTAHTTVALRGGDGECGCGGGADHQEAASKLQLPCQCCLE